MQDSELDRLFVELRTEQVPGSVRAAVHAKIARRRRGWWWVMAPAPVAAALALLMLQAPDVPNPPEPLRAQMQVPDVPVPRPASVVPKRTLRRADPDWQVVKTEKGFAVSWETAKIRIIWLEETP